MKLRYLNVAALLYALAAFPALAGETATGDPTVMLTTLPDDALTLPAFVPPPASRLSGSPAASRQIGVPQNPPPGGLNFFTVRPAHFRRPEVSTALPPQPARVTYTPSTPAALPPRPMTVERRSAFPGTNSNRLRPNLPGLR